MAVTEFERNQREPVTADAKQFWLTNVTRDRLEEYWAAQHQSHRVAITQVVHTLSGLTSLLELGVMAGTNLHLIHRSFPWITLIGCDHSAMAIDFARERLPSEALLYVASPLEMLQAQPDRAVDVIVTCYTLAYFTRHDVVPILLEMLRVGRQALILAEPTVPSGTVLLRQAPMPEWGHDYGVLLASNLPECSRTGRVESAQLRQPVDGCNAVTVCRFS